MEPEFWHRRWARGEIGFHEGEANALLVAHFAALALPAGARVFVPLCGKTRDIAWLLSQGHPVVGAELSPLAIGQLFEGLGVVPEVTPLGAVSRYSAAGIDIFAGDILEVTAAMIGAVDAVYDRAALVAMPPALRARYAAHVAAITQGAAQLVICFEYDQTLVAGPPFSVDGAEVARMYPGRGITLLDRRAVRGGMRGHPAQETVWRVR